MAENNTHTPDRLDTIESRLRRLEERIDRREMREAAVEPWQYLVRRAASLAKAALRQRAKHDGPAARRVDEGEPARRGGGGSRSPSPRRGHPRGLCLCRGNRELLETEAEIERLMLKRGGVARGPQPVS